jgi:LysM repeat protein
MRKVIIALGLVLFLTLALTSTSYAAPPQSGGFWHTVRYGETLSSIGRWYGVNPYTICRANNLYNCNYIWRGQRLWIPRGFAHQPTYYRVKPRSCYCSVCHIVRPGQTLFGISRLYGVPPRMIARANHLYNWNYIYAGQMLCIPHR